MATLSRREMRALADAAVTLGMLAAHSLSSTQTKMATRGVGRVLWVTGLDEIEIEGRRFTAQPPEQTIEAQTAIEHRRK